MIAGTKFCFWANPQKYQTLVPAKTIHLKVGLPEQAVGWFALGLGLVVDVKPT